MPSAVALKSELSSALAGMNVVAVPLAENEALRFPPAAGTTVAVALAENVPVRFAVPGSKEAPVADELKSAVSAPCP